jgi:hypothetical protein
MPARDRSAGRRARSTASGSAAGGAVARSSSVAPDPQIARDQSAHPVTIARTTHATLSESVASSDDERGRKPRGIGGSVLETNGAPAAGVPISLRPKRLFNGATSNAAVKTVSDERGGFTFGDVADGEYEIRSEKNSRYDSAATLVRAGTTSAILVVEKLADSDVSIHGVVESSAGGRLAGVRVEVIGQGSISATTDAHGNYAVRVPAGSRVEQTTLRFRRSGYRDRRWVMSDGQRASEIDVVGNVRLDPANAGVSITGIVTSSEGDPVFNARVQLDSTALGHGYRATTDRAGAFTLTNVDAGTDYRLWVRASSGFKDGILENVVVDAAAQPLSVRLKALGSATLTGRMVTPAGSPVAAFTLWLTSAYGAAARSIAITSDSQGRFVSPEIPEGPAALQTRAAPSLSISGITVAAAGSDVSVVIDVGAERLDGQLVTSEGTAAAGARVLLEWSATSGGVTSRSTRETITDAEGAFAFTELGAGVHVVSASLPGTGSVRVSHPVGASQPPLRITLPARRGTQ